MTTIALCDNQQEFDTILFRNSKMINYLDETNSCSLRKIRDIYPTLAIISKSQIIRCNPVFKYAYSYLLPETYLEDIKVIDAEQPQQLSHIYTCAMNKFPILKLKYEYDFHLDNLKLCKLPDTIEFLTKNYTKNIDFYSSDVQFFQFANPIKSKSKTFVDHFYLGYLVFYPFYVEPKI